MKGYGEPWELRKFCGVWGIWDGAIEIIELGPDSEKDRARGKRIELCINACAGMSNESLQRNMDERRYKDAVIEELSIKCDALKAQLEEKKSS